MNTAFIISQDGVITLFHNGESHTVSSAHANHDAIVEVLSEARYDDLDGLLDVVGAIELVDGRISVSNDRVWFTEDGQDPLEIEGTVAERLLAFIRGKLPYAPLIRFIEKLMLNPSRRSVMELYKFLEHEGLPLTETGNFLGYKGVRSDFLDKHSGKFDNSPGQELSMPRNAVDDDARQACSVGFHVGSQAYASNWAGHDGRVVLVEVNPANAVSVPHEDANKLRVTGYTVIQEIAKTTVLSGEVADDTTLLSASLDPVEEPQDEDDCPCCESTDCPSCDLNDEDEECVCTC